MQKLTDIKNLINADTLSKKGDIYTARKGYFYTHGKSEDDFAKSIEQALPSCKIVGKGAHWASFRGGASVANSSHWWVKFELPEATTKAVMQLASDLENAKNKKTAPPAIETPPVKTGYTLQIIKADGSWMAYDNILPEDAVCEAVMKSYNGISAQLYADENKWQAVKSFGIPNEPMTEEEARAKFAGINWTPLENYLTGLAGTEIRFIKKEFKGAGKHSDAFRFEIETPDLRQHAGICKLMLETLYMGNFGGGFGGWNEQSKSHLPGKDRLWMTLHFGYRHLGGGSNGHEIASAWYKFSTQEWTIRLAGRTETQIING